MQIKYFFGNYFNFSKFFLINIYNLKNIYYIILLKNIIYININKKKFTKIKIIT